MGEVNSNAFFGTFERVTKINSARRYAEYIVAAMNFGSFSQNTKWICK